MKFLRASQIIVWATFVLVGCQADQKPIQEDGQQALESESKMANQVVTPDMKTHAIDTRGQVKTAIRDLAARQGVALNEIKSIRTENVTWRDGSLGCPQKGASYTQALVPGTLIVLSVNGQEFEYHARSGGVPSYCPNPAPPIDQNL